MRFVFSGLRMRLDRSTRKLCQTLCRPISYGDSPAFSITADSAAGLGNRAVPTEILRPSASSHFAPSATARRAAVSRSSDPNVGGPLPGLTTSSQMEPGALDRLCHSIDGMDKRPERVALEATNGVLDANRPVDVPQVSRVRVRERVLRVPECFVQQRLE